MPATSSRRHSTQSDTPVINRRHALGLFAAASLLPSRAFGNVSYQRSEFREDLAKRFFDLGTEGTFVGYKVDDYLSKPFEFDRLLDAVSRHTNEARQRRAAPAAEHPVVHTPETAPAC